ncbi:hypothetical protein JR334_08645 [Clostridia bacterium]|nr:hypothetical protein JR334_08645 [Clostridia bacterium]
MKHDIKKVSKIADEVLTFCLLHKSDKTCMSVTHEEDGFIVEIEAFNIDVTDEQVSRIEEYLNVHRQDEVAEYYWQLAGEIDDENELSLVGMMTDDYSLEFTEHSLKLTLVRKCQKC